MTGGILDATGRPVRPSKSAPSPAVCPKCRQANTRKASAGFGEPHAICGRCGYEWHDEPFQPHTPTEAEWADLGRPAEVTHGR